MAALTGLCAVLSATDFSRLDSRVITHYPLCVPIEDSPRNWRERLVKVDIENRADTVFEPTVVCLLALGEKSISLYGIIPSKTEYE